MGFQRPHEKDGMKKESEIKNNKKLTILGTKMPSISREFFGIKNYRTKVRGIKPTIFNKSEVNKKWKELLKI